MSSKSSSTRRLSNGKSIFDYLEDPKATEALPSLKSVLSELDVLTQKNNVRLDEVTGLVEADQAMSLRVLRMANSVYYAPIVPIMDVQDAILYMGLSTFRGAVISARCIEKTCHIQQSTLDWKEFWIHAAGVGRISMDLASHLREASPGGESIYLMGLLHDIGKVVLAQLMPAEFDRIYFHAAREKVSPAKLEMETLGIDHGHLGAWYMQQQGLSISLCEPVRFHHSSIVEDKPHLRPALLIKLADLLALWFNLGQSGNHIDSGDPFLSKEWQWYLGQCDLADSDGRQLQETVAGQVERTADLVHKIIV